MSTGLLYPSEAAKRLQVHVRTLARWSDRGLLQTVRTPTGHRRYVEEDVDRLHEEMRRGTAPDTRSLERSRRTEERWTSTRGQ